MIIKTMVTYIQQITTFVPDSCHKMLNLTQEAQKQI